MIDPFRACLLSLCAMLMALPPPARASETERNLADFDFAVARITSSYGGWTTKTAGTGGAALQELTRKLRARVASGDDAALRQALTDYVAWFNDGHVQLTWNGTAQAGTWPAERRSLDERQARAEWAALGPSREPIEGVWAIDDRYRLAVVRRGPGPGHHDAVVLSTEAEGWSPGDIKATLALRPDGRFDVRYGMGNRTEGRFVAALVNEGDALLLGDGAGSWRRVYDSPAEQEAAERRWPADLLKLSRVDANTLSLRVPSFGVDQRKPLATLLARHEDELASTPHLIIDVRNNGGGSDASYDPLLDLIWTRPITKIGTEMRVSADNIRLLDGLAVQVQADAPAIGAEIRSVVARMRGATGSYIMTEPRPFEIIRRDTVRAMPVRIAVLVDGAISSAEHFLLAARQSDKVVLMGQANSAGVLDFGNVIGEDSPSGRFSLAWATSRSLRLPGDPVDPDGIAPSVHIPADVRDPIGYAARWLAGRAALDQAAIAD